MLVGQFDRAEPVLTADEGVAGPAGNDVQVQVPNVLTTGRLVVLT
jgi:hypothetical protein